MTDIHKSFIRYRQGDVEHFISLSVLAHVKVHRRKRLEQDALTVSVDCTNGEKLNLEGREASAFLEQFLGEEATVEDRPTTRDDRLTTQLPR